MLRNLMTVVVVTIMFMAVIGAGTAIADDQEVIYRGTWTVVKHDVSPPLRDIKPLPIEPGMTYGGLMVDPESDLLGPLGPQDFDFIVQPLVGFGTEIPSPLVSFDGPSNLAGVSPPDPVGDVGPNHYVAMSNLYFQIFDKTGTSALGPAANNTLWAGFGGDCETDNSGDPIVLHDQLSDRWILTQFTASGPTYFNCVAVSQTSDPTGAYYRYAFSTGSNFPDYPKYGVWPDALYISTREFAGSSFAGVGAYAVNRAQLVAGNPTPTVISFLATPSPAYNVGDGLLPSDLDGSILPPAGSPNYFMGSMDDGGGYGAPQDALTLWKFHADFATPANSTFTLTNTIPINAYDTAPAFCSGRACVPQPATTNKLDSLAYRQRPMHRLAYRNFGTHESLVTNQSVEASPTMSGIRWWEIRSPNGSPVVFQESTYAPGVTDGVHRWMGSIAMDSAGNMALGYSASDGTSTYPSSWYTGRLAADPAGTMSQGEASFINGTGSQTGSNRWGDYTSMNVDPLDDCTFWYVNEYVPTTSSVGWRLRIGSFKFNACGTPDFYLGGSPNPVAICAGTNAVFNITVGQISGFTNAVTLSATGNPAGTTKSFVPNGITPPGASTFTIGNTGGSAPGSYTVTVNGAATGSPGHSLPLGLDVFSVTPNTPALVMPANGALNQSVRPDFEWSTANQGGTYTLEVATDAGFSNVVYTTTVPGTTATPTADFNTNTQHFWRVMSTNTCGPGPWSPTWSFTTLAAPGDCGAGTIPSIHWSDDLETGAPGWTTGGTASTWALGAGVSGSGPHSGANVYHANDSAAVSDQMVMTPPVVLPSGPDHTAISLQFWNYQEMENSGTAACYDGGLLEITTNGGTTWTQLPTAVMQTDPYNGPISSSFSNPLGGRDAWCGSPQDWLRSVVDLNAYAGDTVQFRFRLGTDSSVSRPGWDLDDVSVQSCVAGDLPIFTDGFESGDYTAWSSHTP